MANSTLQNLKQSAFVRTPPHLAERIGRALLAFPHEAFNIYDPTSGEGDFFSACAHVAHARYFGSEISAERANRSRESWPSATIVTSAFEGVNVPARSMSLVLANPPYFFQDGKRAEYRIIADVGESLMPGGILVAILPARSAWDGTMINHWLKYYDRIRVWKFPDRISEEDEGAFEDFTQICVIGVRRAEPAPANLAEKKRLHGYHWRTPEKAGQSGWEQGVPPPVLPEAPIADPYQVPSARMIPTLVVRNADEATLLYALDKSGAHLSPAWQQVCTWPETGYLGSPAMPYTGEAHVAAEVMIGGLDGEIVCGPGTGEDAVPHLFTAFVGQEWVSMYVDEEEQQKLRERGVVRVSVRQLQDKPILGVLNLQQGTSRYYQGEEVFHFLQPWLHTLAARVVEKRKPLYRLDPADWEIRVIAQFGTDKRLPKAAFPGLAIPQMHRVFAMGRSLDVHGYTAIQGEPGTGKTRLAAASAARQAYRWRHRNSAFAGSLQPAWISGLRRAWLKNPATLAMLGLEPVYGRRSKGEAGGKGRLILDATSRQIVAYRDRTGKLIAPEDAGPQALPVLVTTPLKVTKEYGKEIQAAYPQAEVVSIESHRDIPRWLERCATSHAPVVFGIFSHSTTRAFGREWQPVVREKTHVSHVPVLDPDPELLDSLEEVRDSKRRLIGYRFQGSDELLTKAVPVSYYYCPDCTGRIDAVPGQGKQPDEEKERKEQQANGVIKVVQAPDAEEEKRSEPVTSLGWFRQKQRWCKCPTSRRTLERRERGKAPLRTPLWTDDRLKATKRKYPQCSFATWSQVMANLNTTADQTEQQLSTRELTERARRDEALLQRLVAAAIQERAVCTRLIEEAQDSEPVLVRLMQAVQQQEAALASVLMRAVRQEEGLLESLTAEIAGDEDRLTHLLVELARRDCVSLHNLVPSLARSEAEVMLLSLVEEIQRTEAEIERHLIGAARRDQRVLLHLVELSRPLICWHAFFFRTAFEQAQLPTGSASRKSGLSTARGLCLSVADDGPIVVEEPDRNAADTYDAVRDDEGTIVAYQLGQRGRMLVPIYGVRSKRIIGYAHEGLLVTKKTRYGFRQPPADSFNPYQYLYDFFRGCVALSIVDESHNGRGRDTDIAHAHHLAMLAAQTRELTSGTHYGGDVLGFFHYWFRYHPQFWLRLGFGWNDAEQALSRYGVIQEWTKEYESDARRGSGRTDVRVSTIAAPGLSAKLIPGLLEDLSYLTVLDVGAHMPPKTEIPKGISMVDEHLEGAVREAEQIHAQIQRQLAEIQQERQEVLRTSEGVEQQALLAEVEVRERETQLALEETERRLVEVRNWASVRNLSRHYITLVKRLEELAQKRNNAARLAQGTVPRWFAALPCESPFEVWQSERTDWGDKLEPELLVRTPVLSWDHLYPMERWLIETVRKELAEGRRSMVYFEQNAVRSMARRLEWVLSEFKPWTLPNGVEAEDRQQAIIEAVQAGYRVVIVPYRRVNEGLNLQTAIDTIIWYELAMNLFMYFQASQRAWRLGKQEEVRVYLPFYVGTAAHTKLRKLGGQSGAAAAFAGEPAKGELIKHVGADQTTLARLSASLEEDETLLGTETLMQTDDLAEIEAAFARRDEELREALKRGRQWFGVTDTLPERLAALLAQQMPDVWATLPSTVYLQTAETFLQEEAVVADVVIAAPTIPSATEEAVECQPSSTPEFPVEVASLSHVEPEIVEEPVVVEKATTQKLSTRAKVAVFGCEEDIRLARTRRSTRPRRTTPRPKNRTQVKDIPAFVAKDATPSPPTAPTLPALSTLWDLLTLTPDEGEPIGGASPALPPISMPAQSSLWE